MKKLSTLLLFLLPIFFTTDLFAQPANDECANATVLTNVSNWCSNSAAYTNVGATLSSTAQPACFPDVTHDVWFSFVAVATTVHVTVVGNTVGQLPGGTLENPQFAIYSGSCGGALTEVQCASDAFGDNIAETFAGPLFVGQTYFIRVDARSGNTGTFRLCVNNYNAVPDPNSDCPTGVILCDKSSFTVESLNGTGSLQNEFSQGICIQTEFASAWYRWTCKTAGTLTFTLTPTNPSDDLDFAVFELPGGVEDCANKVKIRCEAAGENVGQPFPTWEICTGPTGLSESETDTDEQPGCSGGNNNFVSAIDMEVGKSYALIINNFSNTGNGFSMEFGGSGTFLGPEADFSAVPATACQNDPVTFTDNSTSVEGIGEWQWSFGIGATPATATGKGPHQVSYNSPGTKSVVLTVTSEAGCIVTHIENFTVLPSPTAQGEIIADYCSQSDTTGSIILSATGGKPPYLFNFDDNGFTTNNIIDNLSVGSYSVIVQDSNGCEENFDFVIPEGLSLAVGVDPVHPPTCNGDSDGSISVSIEIANYPVTYDFGNGPQPDSILSNLSAGTYNVHVVDAIGCEGFFTIVVEDFPPLLLGMAPLDISCFGAQDGSITANPTGGAGGYTYLWSNGGTENPIENLSAGNYSVLVTDTNGCTETGDADIIEPDNLAFTVEITNVICAGDSTGVIAVTASGGTPPFEYSTNGTDFQTDPSLSGLAAGSYTVVVRDSRGCMFSLQTVVTEPAPLLVEAGENQTVDLGFEADIKAIVTPLFKPVTLSWMSSETLDCEDCLDPTALPFETTTYYLTATDEVGCSAVDSVTINVVIIRPVYIPNVFSPDGNGLNDFFTVYGGRAAKIVRKLKVFSRWGSLVYEGYDIPLNSETMGWNGIFKDKLMDPAVFAYFAEVEFIDGVVVLFKGDVTLLR